jgi:hypothetical protein
MNIARMMCACCFALWCAMVAWCDEPLAAMDPNKALRAAIHSRELLVSGEFTAEGQFVSKSSKRAGAVRKWKINSAFDSVKQLLWYQDELDLRISDKLVAHQQKFSRTSDRFAYWSDLQGAEGAQLILFYADAKLPDLLTFIDVRAVGIGFLDPFEEKRSLDLAGKLLLERPMTVGGVGKDGLLRLDMRWRPDGDSHEFYRATWLDSKNGYTIRRVEQFAKPFPNELAADPVLWGEAGLTAKYTWINRNGVWCPASVHIEDAASVLGLAFTWKSVNKELPAVLFSEAEMGLSDLTPVYDYRKQPPILLGTLSDHLKGRAPPKSRRPGDR